MLLKANHESIAQAANVLARGGLVAFPTETVYGLGGDARSHAAVELIYKTKGRPSSNPLIVHLANVFDINELADLRNPSIAQRVQKIAPLWPGPLSVVLPSQPGIAAVEHSGLNTIAVRIPNHPIAQELLLQSKIAIAAPSANPSNFISPTTAQHVERYLGSKVEIILDGGESVLGIESTVVDLCSDKIQILRPGFILAETISELMNEEVTYATSVSGEKLSPGMSQMHYSPTTQLRFIDSLPKNVSELKCGYIAFRTQNCGLNFKPEIQMVLSENADPNQIAANLYSALHSLDQHKLDLILVDRCINSGLGMAIMDRLERAVTKL